MLASAKVSSACLVQLWKKLTHQRRFLREDASFPPQYPLSFRKFTMPGMFGDIAKHARDIQFVTHPTFSACFPTRLFHHCGSGQNLLHIYTSTPKRSRTFNYVCATLMCVVFHCPHLQNSVCVCTCTFMEITAAVCYAASVAHALWKCGRHANVNLPPLP